MIPINDVSASDSQVRAKCNRAVQRVVDSGRFIDGPEVSQFEQKFAQFIGTRYCIAVGSGTEALVISLRAAGIGPGDVVLVPSFTFVATVSAVRLVGAIPVFADIDPVTYTLSPESAEARLKVRGGVVKAMIPVHLFGHPVDVYGLRDIAFKYTLTVIEDCCQAHGAEYNQVGNKVGQWGRTGCFSFFPAKPLGAWGDGGAIVSDDERTISRVSMIKDHGRNGLGQSDILGINGRIGELQAAVLREKLKFLPQWLDSRRRIAERYNEAFSDLPVKTPQTEPTMTHAWGVYTILTPDRDDLATYLKEDGISTAKYYDSPVHHQPLFWSSSSQPWLEVTEKTAKQCLSLPIYPNMPEESVEKVIKSIREYYK